MFDDVDNNNHQQSSQDFNSSPASAEVQKSAQEKKQQPSQPQENDKEKSGGAAQTLARGKTVQDEKDKSSSGQDGNSDNQVEDIFAGIDDGSPSRKMIGAQGPSEEPDTSSSSSIFNTATVMFVVIVAVLAGVILGLSYWVSTWLISSLGM